jgi:hypothetical protein
VLRDLREFDRTAAAVSADAFTVANSSRDVSDPTCGPLTLTQGRSGGPHVPAACLRSCDGLRTPMSRTIESGSDRKRRRQFAARSVAIRGRIVRCNDAVMSWSIWRHISPLVALRSLAHRVVDFHAVLGGVNALRLRSDRAFRTAYGR